MSNREDILRMAREAGWTDYSLMHPVELRRLQIFYTLVAADERDRAARIIEAQDVDPAFKARMAAAIRRSSLP